MRSVAASGRALAALRQNRFDLPAAVLQFRDGHLDVRLNGKIVLEGFDIMKESGQPDYAVWKEFTLDVEKDLTVELAGKSGNTVDSMPLISATQILRVK